MDALDIIFFIIPAVMTIAIFVTLFAGIFGKGKNKSNDKPKSERQLKNEELEQRLKNLFKEHEERKEKAGQLYQEAKDILKKADETINDVDLKSNRCKNCGADLELDKNGKKRCPYCQSKYF